MTSLNHFIINPYILALKILRFLRIALAVFMISAITLIFVDAGSCLAHYVHWSARIQLVPALLSGNVIILGVILLSAWLVGRLYCSIVCPLGIFQDIVNRLHIWFCKKSTRRRGIFKYKKANSLLRYILLGCFTALLVLAAFNLVSFTLASVLEPYSDYGRIVSGLGVPFLDAINNVLAGWSQSHDNYLFVTTYRHTSTEITIIGAVTLVVVTVCAWLDGRWYCNNICPVGSGLGLISRHQLVRPLIDTEKCNGCRSCERHCKSLCIDAKSHRIDTSRCVMCMDCISACKQQAITLGVTPLKPVSNTGPASNKVTENPRTKDNPGRRAFLITGGVLTGALASMAAGAAASEGDGGLTPVWSKKSAKRKNKVIPAGALSYANLSQKCVGCQLCINNCPQQVLKPSTNVENFMQPVMDFTEGYCSPECTLCADVCPAGAIGPIDEVLKSSTKIGNAVVDTQRCISAVYGTDCGNCQRHCPAGAITMTWASEDEDDYRSFPVVDASVCIGCGACEYHCPVGTVEITDGDTAAIHVEGISRHRTI